MKKALMLLLLFSLSFKLKCMESSKDGSSVSSVEHNEQCYFQVLPAELKCLIFQLKAEDNLNDLNAIRATCHEFKDLVEVSVDIIVKRLLDKTVRSRVLEEIINKNSKIFAVEKCKDFLASIGIALNCFYGYNSIKSISPLELIYKKFTKEVIRYFASLLVNKILEDRRITPRVASSDRDFLTSHFGIFDTMAISHLIVTISKSDAVFSQLVSESNEQDLQTKRCIVFYTISLCLRYGYSDLLHIMLSLKNSDHTYFIDIISDFRSRIIAQFPDLDEGVSVDNISLLNVLSQNSKQNDAVYRMVLDLLKYGGILNTLLNGLHSQKVKSSLMAIIKDFQDAKKI